MKRPHRAAHGIIWRLLAILLPLAFAATMVARQDGPKEAPAVKPSGDQPQGTKPQ